MLLAGWMALVFRYAIMRLSGLYSMLFFLLLLLLLLRPPPLHTGSGSVRFRFGHLLAFLESWFHLLFVSGLIWFGLLWFGLVLSCWARLGLGLFGLVVWCCVWLCCDELDWIDLGSDGLLSLSFFCCFISDSHSLPIPI